MKPHDGSPSTHIEVVQVWVDPAHRLAHRAPSFRRWLAEKNKPAIIRYSSREGFVLFPPAMTDGQGWVEHESGLMSEHTHTLEEKAAALGGEVEIEIASGDDRMYRTTLKVGDHQVAIGTHAIEDREQARAALARARKYRAEREAMEQRK
jgi:hypothetical protein